MSEVKPLVPRTVRLIMLKKNNDCFTFSGGFFAPDIIKTSQIVVPWAERYLARL